MHGRIATLHHKVTQLAQWLAEPHNDAAIIRELAVLSERDWLAFEGIAAHLFSAEAVEKFLRQARTTFRRSPSAALYAARVATRVAESVNNMDRFAELCGDAWYQYALELKEMDRYPEALTACEQASFYFALDVDTMADSAEPLVLLTTARQPPAPAPGPPQLTQQQGESNEDHANKLSHDARTRLIKKNARAVLVYGRIRCALGEPDGLEFMGGAALTFYRLGRRQEWVSARTMYASGLIALGKTAEAVAVLEDTAVVASLDGDKESEATIYNNVGHCYLKLRDVDRARKCLDCALALFRELGDELRAVHVNFNFARALKEQGCLADALKEFYTVRSDFLRMGMPVVAAKVMLEIVEISLDTEQQQSGAKRVRFACEEMIRTFTDAQLDREGMKALAYLRECARSSSGVRTDQIAEVEAFLSRLEEDAESVFLPPD
jgi:tetratricopeptide (TPR) repeat protein